MGAKGTSTQIVRYSADYAHIVVRNGGRIQPLEHGHAEVIDDQGRAVGYLTKADYAKYKRLYGDTGGIKE